MARTTKHNYSDIKHRPQVLPSGMVQLIGVALRDMHSHPTLLLAMIAEVIVVEVSNMIQEKRRDHFRNRNDVWTWATVESAKAKLGEATRPGGYLSPDQFAALEAIERAWPGIQRKSR